MASSDRPLRMGVVGVGFGSTVHIPALQSEGIEVLAVAARRQERADEAASRFGIAHALTDFQAMLELEGLDAVAIATPPGQHHDMAIAALAAGKHVLCEKPFALDRAQALAMRRAARESGCTAMVAHEFRFASGRMRTKELLEEGYVGAPRLVRANMILGAPPRAGRPPAVYDPRRDEAAQGAGLLFALGSHFIDGLRHWFGEVGSVLGHLANFSPERTRDGEPVAADADNFYFAELSFRSGVLAHLTGTVAAPFGPGAGVEIYGSEGTLIAPQTGPNPPAHGILRGARIGDQSLADLPIPSRLEPFTDDRDDRLTPFRLLVREFLSGIRSGNSPAPNFEDGYRCQQILDAVRESSASGRRVAIDLD
jgi:predicted dehydrogenase